MKASEERATQVKEETTGPKKEPVKIKPSRKKVYAGLLVILVVLVVFIFWMSSYFHNPELPGFVTISPRVQEAYLFIQSNQEVASVVPCFCGCMNSSVRHLSVYDCFIDSNGDYDRHGAYCNICITIALETKKLLNQGYTKEEIAAFIIEKYHG